MFVIFNLKFYGCRGSTPVSSSETLKYGGNTTCIVLEAGTQTIILDCGTGLLSLQKDFFKKGGYQGADIFISHIHWDHVQGIAFFSPFFCPQFHFSFYGEKRLGDSIKQQIYNIMNSPMFPVEADSFNAKMDYYDITDNETRMVKDVQVQTVRLKHPNVCTGYRFTYEGKSVCIVADYEHGEDEKIYGFAKNCDLLVYDAQYTDDEFSAKVGWGHSTWQKALEFYQHTGAKKLVMTHHDPSRTDAQLDALQEKVSQLCPGAVFSREGMTVSIG